jgi:hypothetical protein
MKTTFAVLLYVSMACLAYSSISSAQTQFPVVNRPVSPYIRMGALEIEDSRLENVASFGQLVKVTIKFNYVEECSAQAKAIEIEGSTSTDKTIRPLPGGDVNIALVAKSQTPQVACGGGGQMKKGSFVVYINDSSGFFEWVTYLNVGAPTNGLYKELYKLSAKNGVSNLEKVFMYRFFQGNLETAALGD